MSWFLYSAFLLYLSTQTALYTQLRTFVQTLFYLNLQAIPYDCKSITQVTYLQTNHRLTRTDCNHSQTDYSADTENWRPDSQVFIPVILLSSSPPGAHGQLVHYNVNYKISRGPQQTVIQFINADRLPIHCNQSESICTNGQNLTGCSLIVSLHKSKTANHLCHFAVKLPSHSNYVTICRGIY